MSLTVVDTFGCEATDRLMIYVHKAHEVYIPNAFSPNGDGLNDAFTVYGDPEKIEEVLDLRILQRWGEFVWRHENFQPNDPKLGWDGTHNGELLNSQVFVYWVKVKFRDGAEELFEGGITLVK